MSAQVPASVTRSVMEVETSSASRSFVDQLNQLVSGGYFSCSIDTEVQANGSIRYFEGPSGVYATLLGPQVLAKKNDDACKFFTQSVLEIEVSVKGDPSLDDVSPGK